MRIVILDSFAADQGDVDVLGGAARARRAHGPPAHAPTTTCVARCAGATAALTNKVPFRADAFAALPDLRYVGVLATGTNIVDLDAARAAGVAVTNVPGYATESVARAGVRARPALHARRRRPRRGGEGRAPGRPRPTSASSPSRSSSSRARRWSLVGSGAIGGAVARIAEAFGMRVVRAAVPGSPPRADARAARRGAARGRRRVAALPAHDATRGLVDARFLGRDEAGRDPDQHRARRAGRRERAGRGARERPPRRRRPRRARRGAAPRRSPAHRPARALGRARRRHAAHRLGHGRGAPPARPPR